MNKKKYIYTHIMHIHTCYEICIERDRESNLRRPMSIKEVWEEKENYKFGLKKYMTGAEIRENKDALKELLCCISKDVCFLLYNHLVDDVYSGLM